MDFHYDDYYRPCHDVVFAILFAHKTFFVRLCEAVYGKTITITGEPRSQAVMHENDVLLNTIRFDVLGVADTQQIFTLDIQRRYSKGRQEKRSVYYVCRAVSSQPVENMKYEDLNPVHIAFILTDPKNPQQAANGIRKVGLCYLDTGEPYDGFIELVLVYVPTVVKEADVGTTRDNDLYVFARFFAVSSPEEAAAFAADFKTNPLGEELVRMYNTIVANHQDLQAIEKSPYFTQRLNEAQLAQERAEAEARGISIGEARGISIGEAMGVNKLAELIKSGYDVDTALKMIERNSSAD